MKHAFHRVTSFEIAGPHCLKVSFEDNTTQTIDFSPILVGELYKPLRDVEFFEQVKIDLEVHTLIWPNGADFDPDMLHDWNKNLPAIRAGVAAWESVPA